VSSNPRFQPKKGQNGGVKRKKVGKKKGLPYHFLSKKPISRRTKNDSLTNP
jgi:hypothetical protein